MRRTMFVCLACAIALLVAPGGRAWAVGGYAIDELSTQLTVQTNAAVHVIERQTLTFSDVNAGITWYLHAPEDGESVRIASVRVAPVDDGGTLLDGWTTLQMIDSDPDRQGRMPGDTAAAQLRTTKTQPWYSYNIGDGMVRCYFPTGEMASKAGKASAEAGARAEAGAGAAVGAEADAGVGAEADAGVGAEADAGAESAAGTESDAESDAGAEAESESEVRAGAPYQTYVIETDYTIAHRARVYRDVGELYWRYAHDNLPVDASDVSLRIVLPAPADADPAATADSIRAWGHGPDKGTFAIGSDGTVTYEVTEVARGNYAEAHVIFPAAWLADVAPGAANQFSELRGPAAIAEESSWVDIGLREAAWDNKVRILFLGMALAIILLGVIGALRHGRTPLARRALLRTAAALGITALGESLFFREPLTTVMLTVLALAALAATLALPAKADNG